MTAWLKDVIGYGLQAARPAAGSAGALYYETDTDTLFRDNGATWDALTLGSVSPLTNKGDVFVHGASDARLPVGTDGQVLTADSTQTLGLKWAAASGSGGASVMPAVRAYGTSDLTVPNTTATVIPLAGTDFDQGTATAQHSTSANNSRLTCRTAGIYLIVGMFRFTGGTGGSIRQCRLRVNGTIDIARQNAPNNVTDAQHLCVPSLWPLAIGDYVEMVAYQDSGSSLTVQALRPIAPNDRYSPELMMGLFSL